MAASEVLVLFCGEEFGRGYQYTHEACSAVSGVKVTRCPRGELEDKIGQADVLVPLMTRLDRSLLLKASKAKLILQYGVGLEGVDVETATELGIQVSNIPSSASGNALSCAEMALFLMLTCLRKAREMAASIRNGVLGLPIGETLFGKTVLLAGFGNIAKELVPRLKPLGVRLLSVRQSAWSADELPEASSAPEQLLDLRGSWLQLHDLAAQADIVVLTCTQTPATRGMVGSAFLECCKPGVVIVNVARGGLLDYEAVKAGLRNGRIGALALDVLWHEPFDPEDEIAQHPRVYLTPHVAGVTELSYRQVWPSVARKLGLPGILE